MDNPEHEGYERVLIADLEPMVSGHLAPLKPDVVLLHVGTNDCANNYQTSTMQRYGKLLDMILAELPGVPVLVGTMMKAWVKDTESCLQGFNTKLKELVEGDEYRERKVMLVDMGGVKEEVMVDFLHPNDNGYGVMAEAWYDAIEEARRRGWVRSLAADE